MNSADIRVALIRLSTRNHDIGIAQFESQGRTVTSAKPDTEDAILFSGFGARYSLNQLHKTGYPIPFLRNRSTHGFSRKLNHRGQLA